MKQVIKTVHHTLRRNTPVILSSTAITGVVTTAYLAARAAVEAHRRIDAIESVAGTSDSFKQRMKEQLPIVWKLYIPAGASGIVTIACIVGTTRVTNKRAAAAQAAFVLTERAFAEYRAKVVEEYGERKDQTIRDSIASEFVQKNPPPPANVLVTGPGSVLCCELHTGRYFSSDMESLRRAENDINARLVRHDSATLDDFYYIIGMQPTTTSGDLGWNSDKLLSLEFTSCLDDSGRPCLAFQYNYVRPLFEGMFK